jgi:hypothetical protein
LYAYLIINAFIPSAGVIQGSVLIQNGRHIKTIVKATCEEKEKEKKQQYR